MIASQPFDAVEHAGRARWLMLSTIMIGSVAAILSSTIVNVAIPQLTRYFTLGQERAQWVASGFMLAMTLSMLLTPWLLLRFGLRRTYMAAVWVLLAGGVCGGLSASYPLLLAVRVVEGGCAGIIQPLPAIFVLRAFGDGEQGRAMGIYGFGVVLAPAVGPTIGGLLLEHFGWRSIFFMVVPFCIVALWMSRRLLPASLHAAGDAGRLDWRGLLLVGSATVALLNGMVHLRDAPLEAAAMLALGVACLAGFIGYQLRGATDPLIDMRLFGHRPFAMGALVSFVYGMGLFGSTYLLPIYLQLALEYSPARAGLLLLPAGVALAVTIPLAGRMADCVAPALLIVFGLLLLTISFFALASHSWAATYMGLMAWAAIGRVGLGFVVPSLSLGSMRGVGAELIAQGTSTINFVRQLGGAMGVSLIGIALEWRLAAQAAVPGGQGRALAFHETFAFIGVISTIAILAAWRMCVAPRTGATKR